MKPIHFSSRLDSLSKIITISCLLLIIGIGSWIAITSEFMESGPPIMQITILLTFWGSVFIPILWVPQGFSIYDNTVIIRRIIGNKSINVKGTPEYWVSISKGVRLFGSGGLYGYYGLFWFKGMGRVWVYATRRKNLISITDDAGKKCIISPDNPDKFIRVFQGK